MSINKDKKQTISFNKIEKESRMEVAWHVNVSYFQEGKKISCFVPGYNIYYTCDNVDQVKDKLIFLTRTYFDHYLLGAEKRGIVNLLLDLRKKGFATDSLNTFQQLISRNPKMKSAKMKSVIKKVPKEFSHAANVSVKASLQAVE